MAPYPYWLLVLAWVWAGSSLLAVAIILADVSTGRWQKMAIMNAVWPITALYWGPIGLWGYWAVGRKMSKRHMRKMQAEKHRSGGQQQQSNGQEQQSPTKSQISVAVSHCGAGCTLGDIGGEVLVFYLGALLGAEFGTRLFFDFVFAYALGIVFQYYSIVPMKGLSPGKGIVAALRADTLSIIAFEVGLFAWMALVYYVLFPGPHLRADEVVFWFMMQVGMIIGFFTSYPVNLFLLEKGWKEKMG